MTESLQVRQSRSRQKDLARRPAPATRPTDPNGNRTWVRQRSLPVGAQAGIPTSVARRPSTGPSAQRTSSRVRAVSRFNAGSDGLVSNGGRQETDLERYDRNWTDIQQQLRIIQTGTQLLAGFLLTLPFQPRFTEMSQIQVTVYLILVVLAASISVLALAPVATHRLLFQRRMKPQLVAVANRILLICLAASALLFAGIVLFIFDLVLGTEVPLVVGALLFLCTAGLWIGVPLRVRRRQQADDDLGV